MTKEEKNKKYAELRELLKFARPDINTTRSSESDDDDEEEKM